MDKSESINCRIKALFMYYSLDQGNQNHLILDPQKNEDWIAETIRNFSWEKYDENDNRLDEYMEFLFDELTTLGNTADDDLEFWEQLTRGQKMFYSLLVFEGAVNDGGIFKFFWERPEHIYSFNEVLNTLNLQPLLDDYDVLVDKYEQISPQLEALHNSINFNNKKWEQQYEEAYEKGHELFGEENELGEYFWEKEFKKSFHMAFCSYIESNLGEFISF